MTCDDSSRFGDIRRLVNLTSCTVLDGKNPVAIKTFKYVSSMCSSGSQVVRTRPSGPCAAYQESRVPAV